MKIVYPTLKIAIGRRVSDKLIPSDEKGLRKYYGEISPKVKKAWERVENEI